MLQRIQTPLKSVAEPTCECPTGYMGEYCIDKCDSDDICNNGTCSIINGSIGRRCNCRHGYTGEYCEQISNCETDPDICLNGGKCNQLNTQNLECTCTEGFYGRYCEHKSPCHKDINLCESEKCIFFESLEISICESSCTLFSIQLLLFALMII